MKRLVNAVGGGGPIIYENDEICLWRLSYDNKFIFRWLEKFFKWQKKLRCWNKKMKATPMVSSDSRGIVLQELVP